MQGLPHPLASQELVCCHPEGPSQCMAASHLYGVRIGLWAGLWTHRGTHHLWGDDFLTETQA